jgi:hypothetical protein
VALLFNLDLRLFYLGEEGLMKTDMNFGPPKDVESSPQIQLFLAGDGCFDVVYTKQEIKSAGICQSLVLDVRFTYR